MAERNETGRLNQRRRTRADLLKAAGRLLKDGRVPTIEEVAAEAMVSRATAYRYFPNLEALLVEAPLDGEVPGPQSVFAGDGPADPVERVDRAEAALHEMCYRNEAQLRTLLVNSLTVGRQEDIEGDGDKGEGNDGAAMPARQNRRMPLIEAALAPARERMDAATYEKLCAALALVFGVESMIVFRDVVPLGEEDAREVKQWAIRALVEAALGSRAE